MDVTIRNRPLLPHEYGHTATKIQCSDCTVSVIQPSSISDTENLKESQKTFNFKKVFDQNTNQAEIFESTIVKLLSKTFHEGYDSTIFTYGQTGAGKSYTLVGNELDWNSSAVSASSFERSSSVTQNLSSTQGNLIQQNGNGAQHTQNGISINTNLSSNDNLKSESVDSPNTSESSSRSSTPIALIQEFPNYPTSIKLNKKKKSSPKMFESYQLKESDGIIPRAIDWIYKQLSSDEASEDNYTINISFLQIYDEKIYDLLNFDSSAHLRLRFAPTKEFYVENLFKAQARTSQEAYVLLYNGLKNREVASHNMNLNSSRSHSIFTLEVHSKKDNFKAKCNLCDLAGSEKLSLLSSNPSAKLVKESITINKSLLALGKVITSLSQPNTSNSIQRDPSKKGQSQFIPYRDSKLTSLLRSALGGSSYCILIACIAPSDDYIFENINTLYYASRATNIQNKPVKRLNPKDLVVQKLREKIEQLETENSSLRSLIQKLAGAAIVDLESHEDNQPYEDEDYITDSIDSVENLKAFSHEKDNGIKNLARGVHNDSNEKLSNTSTQTMVHEKSSVHIHMPTVDPELPIRAAGPSREEFMEIQDVSKKLKADNKMLGKKLVDSVKLLKHYIQTTTDTNRQLFELTDENNEYRFENETLNKENIQLREKIDILQTLIVGQESNQQSLRRPSTASIYTRPQTSSSSTNIPNPERFRTRDEEELLNSIRRRRSVVESGNIDYMDQAATYLDRPNVPKLERKDSSSSHLNSRPSTSSSSRTARSRSKTPSSSFPNTSKKVSTISYKKGYIPFSHKYQQHIYKKQNDED